MKGSIGFVLALCLSSTLSLRLWEDGKEYLFREESAVQVNTRDLQSAASGLRLLSDVRVQVRGEKLIVSIENVKEAHYQQTFPAGMWPYRLVTELEKAQDWERHQNEQTQRSQYIESVGYQNGNTFIVTMQNGLIKSIELPEKLSTNGKNMMRALASVLQMDITGRDMDMWKTLEQNIHGECDMEYAILKGERRDIREITKSMSQLRDCKMRNIRMFDNSDAECCNGIKYDYYNDRFYNEKKTEEERRQKREERQRMYRPQPIHATSMTSFIMREKDSQNLDIEKIFSSGAVVVQRFDVEGPTYTTLANRTLYLIEKKDITAEKTVQNPKVYNNLEFEWVQDELRWDEQKSVEELKKRVGGFANGYKLDEDQQAIVELLKKKIKDHVMEMERYIEPVKQRDEAVRRLHENSLQKLIPLVANLDYNNLNLLKQFYLTQRTDDNLIIAQRNIFIEILPVAGTAPAALIIRDIVLNNELNSDLENARILASLPFHIRPIKTLVDEFYRLLQQKNAKPHLNRPLTRNALDLSYAHLVRRTCVEKETEEVCFKALNIEEFIRRLDQLSEEDVKNQKHMMLVLRNFQETDLLEKKLLSIVRNTENKKYKTEVRTQAVFALSKRAIRKNLAIDYFLPIFLKRDEFHELRIAAFDVLIQGKLTTSTVDKIITHMKYDPDMEVFNYVLTAFEKLEQALNEPCNKENREYARYFMKFWRQNMWQKPKYSFGLSKAYSNFFVNEKHGYAGSVDIKMLGYHKTMTPLSIQMDVRSQRYNHVSMRDMGVYIRMEGIAPRIVDKIKSLTRIGQLKVDELKQLLINDMNIRQRDDIPAKLDLALMMRDQVVLNYHLEDREVMNVMEGIRDYIMSFTSYEALFQFNRHLSIVWDKLNIEVPTDFGVPMAYKKNAMTIVGLMGELKKQTGIKADLKLKLNWHTFNTEQMFTIHPQNNIRFAIQQDRVFKHQLTTAARAEVDLETRRLVVSLIVPEQEAPLSWLGHSQTYLITRENKIAERQTLLKKSCPTCETPLVVSRGKEQRRNVELIDNYRKYLAIYGLNVDAKLFDCELRDAQSFGQAYKHLLQSFNPATKEPRNFFNVVFSGLRQLRNYLFYFPRVESCGINLVLARSTSDPVKEIKMVLDLKKYEVLERPRQIGRERNLVINGDIIFRGTVDRVHKIDVEYKVDNMWAESRLDIDIRRQPFTAGGKTFEEWPLTLTMKTKPMPKRNDRSILMKDLTSAEKYRIRSDTKIVWGRPEKRIIIEGEHKTTLEGIDHLRNTWYYRQCLKQKEQPEWRQVDTLPVTDACLFALQDMMTLRQHTWDISATNLQPWMVNIYRKIGALIKTNLYAYWDLRPEYTSHQITPSEPKIRIEQTFHPKNKMFDLTLRYDKDVSQFMGVPTKRIGLMNLVDAEEPIRSLQNFFRLPLPLFHTSYLTPETLNYLYYNQHINTCTVNRANIRTFDNVTYTYEKQDTCYTLVAADCVENPTFAVFMKKDERTQQIALLAKIGNIDTEIIPVNDREFQLFVKGDSGKQGPIDLKNNDFLYVNDRKMNEPNKLDNDYIFRVLKKDRKVILDFYPQMMLNYDGNSINVVAAPQIRGRNCGLCGDYNRNLINELKDPQMCVLRNGKEMVQAWTLKKQCNSQITKPACEMPFSDRILY